jgi:hypothetical protein
MPEPLFFQSNTQLDRLAKGRKWRQLIADYERHLQHTQDLLDEALKLMNAGDHDLRREIVRHAYTLQANGNTGPLNEAFRKRAALQSLATMRKEEEQNRAFLLEKMLRQKGVNL